MPIKTITGSSIQAALAEARATLGDDVVLLESVAAQADEPARITVMTDARRPVRQPEPVAAGAEVAPLGHGYASARATAPRRPLFTPPGPASAPAPPAGPSPEVLAKLDALASRFDALDRMGARMDAMEGLAARLDRLERRLGEALVGTTHRWSGHPLYGALLREGLMPATVTALLDTAVERGLDPDRLGDEDRRMVLWTVAQALRDRLAPTAPSRYTADALVAVGPGGSGKTALLLRLASDPRFYGRREVGVLVVVPEDAPPSFDPTEPYRQQGRDARTVRSAEEVRQALDHFHGTDALLIDTPSLPASEAEARRAMDRLADVLAPLTAFEVVLTLDAARAKPPFDLRMLDTLALPPTLAALTRLDEVEDWGRVIEWLLALHRPVAFAAMGPGLSGALMPYSPAWFVEAFTTRLDA